MTSAVPRYRSVDHPFTSWTAWHAERPAERIDDHTLMSRSNSNSYLVETDDGDVVINVGTAYQGERHRERYEQLLGRPLRVRKIILGQSHPDHIGGWAAFDGAGVETIAHEYFPEGRLDRTRLAEFFQRRSSRIMGRKIGYTNDDARRHAYFETPEPKVTTLLSDSYAFELGGRRFELYSVPGGETKDCLAVWLPGDRTVFTMNLLGALFPQIPHLSTIRGDRLRSARLYIESVDRILALEPELLITGHDVPIDGAERIRFELTRLRDGVQYIHDETVKGMNKGKDMSTLMREIELPDRLEVGPNRGPLPWSVRAVWEEYTGWFRFESATELYPVPAREIWSELAELAGGPDVLAERAAAHVAAGYPVRALHFTDIALSVDPQHRGVREAQIAALEALIDETGGDYFDLLAYLESELIDARAALERP
jgi:glyoxylase-like metal-dependent hydrolase (beta-lactamase superfamily II)